MSMFCFQCQEAAKGEACTVKGVCGKSDGAASLMDLLIYTCKGLALYANEANEKGENTDTIDHYIMEALFMTITNANFDEEDIAEKINEGLKLRAETKSALLSKGSSLGTDPHDAATWWGNGMDEYRKKADEVRIPKQSPDEDVRSLRELLTYGIKGMAAYAHHAYMLGKESPEVFRFISKGLAATTDDSLDADQLTGLVLECGKYGVDTMALLDQANTGAYGHPEITEVNIGTRDKPGILISGHDLKDMEELLEQTKGTGVDVYTHSEMLPAHYYPKFKKYDHFVGNYGGSWWRQKEEFESFNGPVLMTTNCLVPPRDSYKDRVFTTGVVGFKGLKHITERKDGKPKDFSPLIEMAKNSQPPKEIETGTITGGFAHGQVMQLADKVVDAVKSGAIKKFFVMAGCDGRMKSRDYYTEFADKLPQDTVILTAGCAKYRYNKLPLGDIGGIPRVLDAGQCNDSYSLAVVALKLKEVFELNDINELPIEYNIAWYEQKAVIVLLALLSLGVKNIKLGPTLPAFLSPNVAKVLVEKFNISTVNSPQEDVAEMMA